jgi:hypothetical protein
MYRDHHSSSMSFDRFVELHTLLAMEQHLYSISNYGFGGNLEKDDE